MLRIIAILVFIPIVLSLAFIFYKIIAKKLEEEREKAEKLMQTELGRDYLQKQKIKYEKFAKIALPFTYALFFIILLVSIGGTIFVVREYYQKGFENFTAGDLKLLVYPVLSMYFALVVYRIIKTKR